MASAFEDNALGLKLRGYSIVPNELLETKIAIYTPEIVESILMEHPEVVDGWLKKLHAEYVRQKKQCDLENDAVACFTLPVYEHYEKNFRSWDEGGLIAISLPTGKVIRVSKNPLITVVTGAGNLVCRKCMATFATVEELEKHTKQEEQALTQEKRVIVKVKETAPNPIWWLAP
jgi:hypothetical protein